MTEVIEILQIINDETQIIEVESTEAALIEIDSGGGGATVVGGLTAFVHTQSVASALWVINHNLGYIPSVTVFSAGSAEIECDVIHTSNNQVQIILISAITGFARLI